MKWAQRELEFRAWREDLQIWIKNKDSTTHFRLGDFPPTAVPMIIVQYTGVKDINEKKIFEGDIVESGGKIGAVIYQHTGYYIKVSMGGKECFYYQSMTGISTILGNVFQNPELVEKYKLETG